jgi:photosystem II stability/assembly factor-like uncharacterized protein
MRKFFLVLLAALVPAAASAQPEWQLLANSPDHGTGTRHEDLWFTSPTEGWVVNGYGRILHTSDSGESWQVQLNRLVFFRSVTFATPLRGWAGTLYNANDGLYETSDGGQHWSLVTNLPPGMPLGTCGMWAASDSVVYGVGRYYTPASLLKTTDAGATWTYTDMTPWAGSLVDCYFPTPDLGFAVGGLGEYPDSTRAVVLRTTDGGTSWETRHTSSRQGEWGWKISFPSASVGYVSVESETAPMRVLETTDGGLSWTELPAPEENEQGIGFVTEEVGWLGGHSNPTYSTSDGGATWQTFGVMENLNRIRVISEDLAYAVGRRVYRYSSSPPSAADGMPPASVAALQPSAPNPFTKSTVVSFSVPRAGFARLAVFDVSGRLIATLQDGPVAAGRHRLRWNGLDERGGSVATGVYFLRLETGERAETEKVLRVR